MPKRSRTPSPALEATKKLKSKSKSKSSRTCAVCLGSIEKEGWQPCPRNGRHGMCLGCAVQVKTTAREGHRKHACPTCRASLSASKSSPPLNESRLPFEVALGLMHYRTQRSAVTPGYIQTTTNRQERALERAHVDHLIRQYMSARR